MTIYPNGYKNNLQNGAKRFSIVGFMGEYILKPPSQQWNQLPELEDLTMHLAEIAGIKTVPHSLISMGDGSLAYITKRIDRKGKQKIHMEDMCQLTERMTEHKYQGGYEQILRAIMKYSVNPGLDAQTFFEVLLFSFITGNADMHLKNFSLIDQPQLGYVLSAAYDLVPSAIVLPEDKEEMALFLNSKKNKLSRKDFENLFSRANLSPSQQDRIFERMRKSTPAWQECIQNSFISEAKKQKYQALIENRIKRLGL